MQSRAIYLTLFNHLLKYLSIMTTEKTQFKVGDKVKSGWMEGEVLIVYEPTERTPVDMKLNPIGKSFIDYDLLVKYTNKKGKMIKGIWTARNTKLIK